MSVYIGPDALPQLLEYIHAHELRRFCLVADYNTYPAQGERLAAALEADGCDVKRVIFEGPEVVADANHILRLLVECNGEPCVYLAVGGGTITDITRFVSHRTRNSFIVVPTAPSVDGFTSIGAPLVVDGVKRTILSQPPRALFADLDVLRAAPRRLIAAGYGDMIGKLLSGADWLLGHLLWGEPYSDEIATRLRRVADESAGYAGQVGNGEEAGICSLMNGLVESGFCMLDFGNSNPASGAEHHMSHFWELWLLRHGRPAIYHGSKVGIASVMTARLYREVAALGREGAERRLRSANPRPTAAQCEELAHAFGPIASQILEANAPFAEMSDQRLASLKLRIVDRWDDIEAIAAGLPSPEHIAELLRMAGGVVEPAEVGLGEEEVRLAASYGHYLRERFTIAKLANLLGMTGWWTNGEGDSSR